ARWHVFDDTLIDECTHRTELESELRPALEPGIRAALSAGLRSPPSRHRWCGGPPTLEPSDTRAPVPRPVPRGRRTNGAHRLHWRVGTRRGVCATATVAGGFLLSPLALRELVAPAGCRAAARLDGAGNRLGGGSRARLPVAQSE